MNIIKIFSTAAIKVFLFLLAVYAISATVAYATQTVVNPSDISNDYICIKDSFPDAYYCMPKNKDPIPWYLDL